jgi:hypothetical protein
MTSEEAENFRLSKERQIALGEHFKRYANSVARELTAAGLGREWIGEAVGNIILESAILCFRKSNLLDDEIRKNFEAALEKPVSLVSACEYLHARKLLK